MASIVHKTIGGESNGDSFGHAVSLSSDGSIVAISAPSNEGTLTSFGELEIGNGGDIVLTEDQRIYFEADKNTYIETHAADSFRVVVNERQML